MLVCWHSCKYLSPALSSWSPIPFVIRTYKPTESDLEDDDDEEEEEEEDEDGRPSWFDEDDQDDGIKGQDIVEPDYDDLSNIIRIDEARIPWSIPREE